jgi:transposase
VVTTDCYRREVRKRGITPQIARRGTPHGPGLGGQRWVVERTIAWLRGFRRLLVRYERRADMHEAFLDHACRVICFRRLRASCETSS